jgi:hypothetical protein
VGRSGKVELQLGLAGCESGGEDEDGVGGVWAGCKMRTYKYMYG